MNTDPGDVCVIVRLTGRVLWLLGLIVPACAMAQQPTPGVPGYYNPWSISGPYQQHQNSVPAAAPGNPLQPQAGPQPFAAPPPWVYPRMRTAPAYPQQPSAPARTRVSRPYLEVSVDSNEAYVHQNLVLTLQVVSTVNLKTVAAELPDSDDVIFRQLGEITASTRTRQGQREIVNTMYYQLTPLRSGNIELASISVSGRLEGRLPAGTSYYEAVASQPVTLRVLDPVAGVQPWLPLHELELSASLSDDEHIGAGEPLTLTVEQRAVGMSGTQLPSLESQLQAPGQRLYRENSEYQGTVSKQGALVGSRKDRFTLVPQQGNRVEIPAIRIDWWNVERRRKETAVLPGRLLNEGGRRVQGQGQVSSLLSGAMGAVPFWLALLATAFLLGRYWSRLVPLMQRSGRRLWQELDAGSRPLRQQMSTLLRRLSPQRNLPLIRRRIADTLPCSARLWFCVRSADEEQDPDDWSQVLRFLINRRLGLSAQLPMSKLAEHIIEIHPGADADRIRSLLSELEQAVFAGRPMRDFNAWKIEFKYQIRPRPFAWLRHRRGYLRRTGLPDLNPGVN